uniref:Uncharacterized protein n=1 Tax=Nelumbo nucifera TaxID=4432 RepID=A0A822YSS0_NELNU|nr:TPA_asm: hypothetical protein HUJ06_012687 [Nelumbo nucifera]
MPKVCVPTGRTKIGEQRKILPGLKLNFLMYRYDRKHHQDHSVKQQIK